MISARSSQGRAPTRRYERCQLDTYKDAGHLDLDVLCAPASRRCEGPAVLLASWASPQDCSSRLLSADFLGRGPRRAAELISFVRSDREYSPLRTAPGGSEPGPVFVRSDRSRELRPIGTDEKLVIGRGQRLGRARRPGVVRTDEHEPRSDESAVARHEQLRSDLANKTTERRIAAAGASGGWWRPSRSAFTRRILDRRKMPRKREAQVLADDGFYARTRKVMRHLSLGWL